MAATTTSATATIIQAAEHVIIDEATAVAKTVATKNAADIKTIVNGVAKETVAASDDSFSTIVSNIEDGAKVIGGEIVKGAEAVVDAVEKHPELIAEGALALGVGVASLVQPELIVGSVALVGKMAADATKDTINQIVVESGSNVVKGVSKEVTEETAELAAQDAAEKAKNAALETAKDGSKAGVEATVDVKSTGNVTTEVTTPEKSKDGEQPGKKVTTTVSGDATATVRKVTPGDVPGPIISEETVQTSATSTSEINGDSKVTTTAGPSVVVTKNDLTDDKTAAVQKGSVTAVVEKSASSEAATGKASIEQSQVAVSNVDVKVLAKEVAREMTELEAAKSTQTGEKTLESSVMTDKSLKAAAAKLEANIKKSAAKAEAEAKEDSDIVQAQSEPTKEPVAVENISSQGDKGKVSEDVEQSPNIRSEKNSFKVEGTPTLMQLGMIHSDENKEEAATTSITAIEKTEKDVPKPLISEAVTTSEVEKKSESVPPAGLKPSVSEDKKAASDISEPYTEPSKHEAKPKDTPETDVQSTSDTPPTSPTSDATAHAVTHAAVLEAHEKIAALHQSNELLHQKLDAMQEALLAITKALSERASAPPTSTVASEPVSTADNQIVLVSPNPPSTAAINKRMSVFGSIGWLFGAGSGSGSGAKKHKRGTSIATSTPASVTAGGVETSGS